MRLDGVSATGCCLGVRDDGASVALLGVEGRGDGLRSGANLVTESSLVAANGGGNGDIESAEVEAV